MRDANDQNDELIVPDFVHDAVVSNPEPSQSPKVALQRRSEMGGLGQAVDGGDDARPVRLGDTPQLPDRALLNPYRVAHA